MIQLTFYLEPVGKARARPFRSKGKVITYTPDKTTYAESLIRTQVIKWADKKGVKTFPIYERGLPLHMTATFVRSRPGSLSKRKVSPATKPDLDNLTKLLMDSLRDVIYADDSQIVGMLLEKEYVKIDGLPRIEFSIWEALPGDQPVKERRKHAGKRTSRKGHRGD